MSSNLYHGADPGRVPRWVVRLPAWVALATVIVVLLALISGRPDTDAWSQSGAWQARVELPDGRVRAAVVTLPGLFTLNGIPGNARVIAYRQVTQSVEPLAILVDRPKYAITATWDGTPIGSVGDPYDQGPTSRSTASLFALIPPGTAGTDHLLGLAIRGDFGEGGIVGRVLVGPVQEVHEAALFSEVRRLSLALGASLLAALPLVVATRGAWRPTYLLYGLFTAFLALSSLLQTDQLARLWPHAEPALRLLRASAPLTAAFGMAYATVFVQGRLYWPEWVGVALGGVAALIAAVCSPALLGPLEFGSDALLVGQVALAAVQVFDGLRRRVPGGGMLALGFGAAMVLIPTEITLTEGLRSGLTIVAPAGLVLVVCFGAALVLRDAQSSEQHERLVRGSLDAMVTVDPDGRVHYANPAAYREVLNARADGEIQLLDLVAEADRPTVRGHLARARTRADRTEFGSVTGRVYESLATPMASHALMLTLRDVSHRKELDRAMRQAARVEIAGTLLGGVAHDFNNTLQAFLAHIGMLSSRITDPWAIDRFRLMEVAVDRAADLTRRLLTVARGTGSDLGSVNLGQVCTGAIQLVEPTWPKGVTLSLALPPNLAPVLGAAGNLEQVVLNLLVNARDAVGERGRIRMAVREFGVGAHFRGAALMVEDDGPGVPDELKEEVFQPFVTTKVRGIGLGLAVARQILRDHQGRLWVEDRPSGGARFLLAVWHADIVEDAPAPLPRGRSIVLVEDEQVLLEDYAQALRTAGYQVAAFASPILAARHLERSTPDLLVTDLAMPGMDGIALARLCASNHPDTPILVVSALIPTESLRDLQAEWQPLHKPVRAARLVAAVGRMVRRAERRRAGSEEITRIHYLFPNLADLTASGLGFDERDADVGYERIVFPKPG